MAALLTPDRPVTTEVLRRRELLWRVDVTGLRLAEAADVLADGRSSAATRWVGRQADPLYTVDLSDPAAPEVVGELKIPGFSAYVHPVGEGRLIGVGQDASDEGVTGGVQVSLFDVSDPADPRRTDTVTVPRSESPVQWDHRAFLHWPATGLTVVPVTRYLWGEPGEERPTGPGFGRAGAPPRARHPAGRGPPRTRRPGAAPRGPVRTPPRPRSHGPSRARTPARSSGRWSPVTGWSPCPSAA